MSAQIIDGNIFTTECQTIVNTVNCVGVMGAGIALECKLRYPDLYDRYVTLCEDDQIDIGILWIFKIEDRWILNFPTKKHWKYPSKLEYLHQGLRKFVATYKSKGISSIAFPLLGADKGGIPQSTSLKIMQQYLDTIDIPVEIYRYKLGAKDDLFDKTKELLLSKNIDDIVVDTGLRVNYVKKVLDAMQNSDITQLNQLATVNGVGIKTLEKIFHYANNNKSATNVQSGLF